MKTASLFLSAALLGLLAPATNAATIVHTTSAAFLAQVAPGAYTENFDGLPMPPVGPVVFTNGSFSYSVSAPSDIYASGDFIGTSQIDEALTINFTSNNVMAVGANFFATDLNDDFQSVLMTLTLSDGTLVSFTPASLGDSYRGFVSDALITSLTISGPGASLYAGLDNLTVGSIPNRVPEPASLLLVGLSLAGMSVARRRA